MKPNEILGTIGLLGMFATWIIFFEIGFNILGLLIVFLFGIISMTGFSLWGLWTFNPWFDKTFN